MTVEQAQKLSSPRQPVDADDKSWVIDTSLGLNDVEQKEIKEAEECVDRAVRELGIGMGLGGEEVKVNRANVARELTGEWVGWRNKKARGVYKKGEAWDAVRKWEALKEDIEGLSGEQGKDGVVLWLHGGECFLAWPCG